jgi:hypothetical protein
MLEGFEIHACGVVVDQPWKAPKIAFGSSRIEEFRNIDGGPASRSLFCDSVSLPVCNEGLRGFDDYVNQRARYRNSLGDPVRT